MSFNIPDNDPVLARLFLEAQRLNRTENHLKSLLRSPHRFERFSFSEAGIFYDISRQRIDEKTITLLIELAGRQKLKSRFNAMMEGERINTTENRAALHTALRSFSEDPIYLNGINVMTEIREERNRMCKFSENIRQGKIVGSAGKPFQHLVVVGIGGSYLGTEFVHTALSPQFNTPFKLHFLANVDSYAFGRVISEIDPETTLWMIISKSYTTSETMANAKLATEFMAQKGLDPKKHFIAVAGKGSPGDDPENPVLNTFHMFDFIGGRFSVSSAVGGIPLSIVWGYDVFERFLKGAESMDRHARTAPEDKNIPLIAALISIWNHSFMGYGAQAIVPYASPFSKLAPHIQQLHMESNGKSVAVSGVPLETPVGSIIFGEPGTNAQHSFFQLAHQGPPFPIDFIGVVQPFEGVSPTYSKGVTNHQELWANLISQASALAAGEENENKAKHFPGNRPSSTILINDLSPENIGRLLSFYEAKTVYEAFLWGINPFDQFGVELGKTTATGLRKEMAARNENSTHSFDHLDAITRFYLETLFSEKM